MTIKILNEAMLFALKAHGDQMYGRKPYQCHLLDVVNVVRRFHDWDELKQELINAAWLHDTVEDTDVAVAHIQAHFGIKVAALVDAVSNPPKSEYPSRKDRHAIVYPKIRTTPGAITLKLADRIANIENCISHDRIGRKPGKLFNMYHKEWEGFQEELRRRCAGEGYIAQAMWAHLDDLFAKGIRR